MTTYNEYISAQHLEKLKSNAYYIGKIPADELTYEMCCAAVKKAAGDCEFFKYFLEKYPQFVDENLCKIVVSAKTKKKFVRSVPVMEDPDGTVYYDEEYKYFDPVIKYIPENLRTVDVCRASAKCDWRTLCYVPAAIQLLAPDICETAVSNYHQIMTDDVGFDSQKRKKIIFDSLNKSVFEKHPGILDGQYTLENTSSKWAMENPEQIETILLKQPKYIKKLPKDFRKQHFDVIRNVLAKNPQILAYLTASEQQDLHDIIHAVAEKNLEIVVYLCAAEQKALCDLVDKALKTGKIMLDSVAPSVQVLIPETCVGKLTKDPYERHWYGVSWAWEPIPGLNLSGLCKELQNQNPELISKLVCEHFQLLERVNTDVLIAHPEICVAAIEKHGASVFEKIPKAVFDKHPDLYKKLLQKAPGLLPDMPKEIQTRETWLDVLAMAPHMASSAPAKYVTIEHYKNAVAHGMLLCRVPKKFRTYEICKAAVTEYTGNIDDVPDEIKVAHPDICEFVIAETPSRIRYLSKEVQLQNPNLCKLAVSSDPKTIEFIKPEVQRKYPEICRLAFAQMIRDFGPTLTQYFAAMLEDKKKAMYANIAQDVLKQHWDYINDFRHTITVAKSSSDFCR